MTKAVEKGFEMTQLTYRVLHSHALTREIAVGPPFGFVQRPVAAGFVGRADRVVGQGSGQAIKGFVANDGDTSRDGFQQTRLTKERQVMSPSGIRVVSEIVCNQKTTRV